MSDQHDIESSAILPESIASTPEDARYWASVTQTVGTMLLAKFGVKTASSLRNFCGILSSAQTGPVMEELLDSVLCYVFTQRERERDRRFRQLAAKKRRKEQVASAAVRQQGERACWKDLKARLAKRSGETEQDHLDRLQSHNGRKYRRKRMYSLSEAQHKRLLSTASCEICGVRLTERGATRRCVDHEHKENGRIRGVLCGRCNSGIGFLCDDPKLLNDAIAYLTRRPRYGKRRKPAGHI